MTAPLFLQLKGSRDLVLCTPSLFSSLLGIEYLASLRFQTPSIENKIRNLCSLACQRQETLVQQKWLGCYYAEALHALVLPKMSIQWIDDRVGYGVVAEETIQKGAFLGEYVGVVRKKKFFGRFSNDYCFDYTISFGKPIVYVIDAEKKGNHTRYINHAIPGNVIAASALDEGVMHVIFYASEKIPIGTEIRYDYGENYWKGRKKPQAY